MTKTTVLYHARCTDGAGAMWAAWKHFGDNAEYIPVGKESKQHSRILNLCSDSDDVYMCDCMLEPNNIASIVRNGANVYLLDHHISNIEKWKEYSEKLENFDIRNKVKNFTDLGRSGAGITWDFFHPEKSRPAIINYVEDVDLWRWALPDGENIATYLSQFNWQTNDVIIELFNEFEKMSTKQLSIKGQPLVEFKKNIINKNLSQVLRAKVDVIMPTPQSRIVRTFNVPILNTNHFISETGNLMAKNESFAIIWQMVSSGEIRVSLRSDENGEDVSKICSFLGERGGGHVHAGGTRFKNIENMLESIEFITNE